jgi:diguanylate cyclase (GGDEF)-like protein
MQLHASTDDLTGVLNRRYFFKMASSLLERARRRQKPLSLMVLDMDHFKAVNDTHGHLDGDAVLRRVAEVLGENLRSDDVLGRYGGEEFIIILPDTPLQPHGEKAAERLRQAVATERFISNEGVEFGCTISIGVAELTKDDTSLARLFQRADRALYDVKANGRNGVSLRR